jgi:dTMP kinase
MASRKLKKGMQKPKGLLIAFEGGEGAGKSTQRKRLVSLLKRSGFRLALTREPGGTTIGKRIRWLLLNPRFKEMSARAEILLYEADRAQNFHERILPALEKGYVVVTDRSMYSSTVYQGICRGLGEETINGLNEFATYDRKPDLVLLLDLPVSIGQERLKSRKGLDRLERESRAFHEKVRRGFLKMARQEPSRFVVINAQLSPDAVFAHILRAVLRRMEKKSGGRRG